MAYPDMEYYSATTRNRAPTQVPIWMDLGKIMLSGDAIYKTYDSIHMKHSELKAKMSKNKNEWLPSARTNREDCQVMAEEHRISSCLMKIP